MSDKDFFPLAADASADQGIKLHQRLVGWLVIAFAASGYGRCDLLHIEGTIIFQCFHGLLLSGSL
ncbi:hypothetical protein [Ruminiclostridium cellobioparum]|uniref:hypothetical protein n=1 Tax=Ruminiclostridium cellobioparum TaxID=29355 RepID=UPI0028ABC47A|nr:hypothetical protein [Ruminiclostridium cellobioparum]